MARILPSGPVSPFPSVDVEAYRDAIPRPLSDEPVIRYDPGPAEITLRMDHVFHNGGALFAEYQPTEDELASLRDEIAMLIDRRLAHRRTSVGS